MNIIRKPYVTPRNQTFELLAEAPLFGTSDISSGGNSSGLQGNGVIEAQSQKKNPIWENPTLEKE